MQVGRWRQHGRRRAEEVAAGQGPQEDEMEEDPGEGTSSQGTARTRLNSKRTIQDRDSDSDEPPPKH